MHKSILHVCVIFTALLLVVSCKKAEAMNEAEARSLANEAIKIYCKDKAGDCRRLEFAGLTKSDDRWLVEYRSDRYLLAVTVSDGGTTEISHFREDRPGVIKGD